MDSNISSNSNLHSFLDVSPPRPTLVNQSRKISHARSFSKLIFGSSPAKDEESSSDDLSRRSPTRAENGFAMGLLSSLSRNKSQPSAKLTKPTLSVKTMNLHKKSSVQSPATAPPTRPPTRPYHDILSDDPFQATYSYPSSPAKSKTSPPQTAMSSSSREWGGSTSSSTSNSSLGPSTPPDYLEQSAASIVPSTDGAQFARIPENSPRKSRPVLRGMPSLAMAPEATYKAASPSKLVGSQTIEMPLVSPSPLRPHQPGHTRSSSVSTRRPHCRPPPPPPSAPLLLPSPTEAPTLRHALRAQQQKYDTLSSQLSRTEAAKEERERRITLLEEQAAKREQELQGLRWLVMNLDSTQGEGSNEERLRRAKSVPSLSESPPLPQAAPLPRLPVVSPLNTRAGLGIAIETSPSPPRSRAPKAATYTSGGRGSVGPESVVAHGRDRLNSSTSRLAKRSGTLLSLDLLKDDLRTFMEEEQPSPASVYE